MQVSLGNVLSVIGAGLLLLVAARIVIRWRSASPAERPLWNPILFAVAAYVLVLAVQWLDRLIGANAVTDIANSWPGGLTDYGFPLAMLYILARDQRALGRDQLAGSAAS